MKIKETELRKENDDITFLRKVLERDQIREGVGRGCRGGGIAEADTRESMTDPGERWEKECPF